jgi:hypothetical protein
MPDNILQKFEKRLRTNKNIESITRDEHKYLVKRRQGSLLVIVLVSEYAVSENDVTDLLEQFGPDLDCIVSLSDYHQYTTRAAETAAMAGLQLLSADEFMAAVTRPDWP